MIWKQFGYQNITSWTREMKRMVHAQGMEMALNGASEVFTAASNMREARFQVDVLLSNYSERR